MNKNNKNLTGIAAADCFCSLSLSVLRPAPRNAGPSPSLKLELGLIFCMINMFETAGRSLELCRKIETGDIYFVHNFITMINVKTHIVVILAK